MIKLPLTFSSKHKKIYQQLVDYIETLEKYLAYIHRLNFNKKNSLNFFTDDEEILEFINKPSDIVQTLNFQKKLKQLEKILEINNHEKTHDILDAIKNLNLKRKK